MADLKGTLVFNGLSFSGADIKCVLHTYNEPRSDDRTISQRSDQIERELAELRAELSLIDAQASSIETAPPATRQARNAELVLLQDSRHRITLALAQLERTRAEVMTRALDFEVLPSPTKVLAEIQTLSVSVHREKYPVRALGSVYPRSFTRGPRTIAGSMVFTVFNQHVLYDILESDPNDAGSNITSALIDQLPPFDITVAFANEYGMQARMAVLGCEFVNEGQVMSIEDLLLENEVQYVARDMDPMRVVANRRLDERARVAVTEAARSASSLLAEASYRAYSRKINPWARKRGDPFA